MAIEKRWAAIAPRPFSVNGSSQGVITIATTSRFKTKQEIRLISDAQNDELILEIKRVLSKTQLVVGPKSSDLTVVADISGYTVADSAAIYAKEQSRPSIPAQEHERAVFEEEPTVAKRVFVVDELGAPINDANPLPVTSTGGGSDTDPQEPQIFRIDYPTANQELSQLLPDNTRKVSICIDKYDALLRLAYIADGTMDGGNYISVHLGNSYDRENIKLIGKTLYFQANKPDKTVIIEIWT